MSHARNDDPIIPKPALYAAGALMLGSLAFVYLARDAGVGLQPAPTAAAVESRSLSFDKTPGGDMTVRDGVSGQVVALLSNQEDGLMRAMLRGLKHGRAIKNASGAPIYVLTRYADGRLTLSDPQSGMDVALGSFGGRNKAMFAQLLPSAEETR